jgi:cytochrome c oxidase cbb3-type subunit 1
MNTTLGLLLALSFVVSLAALGVLIWAIANRQIGAGKTEASSIFLAGESGHLDDPSSGAGAHRFDAQRAGVDRPGRQVVQALTLVATGFLIVGSLFGMMASLKLHMPDWLAGLPFTTFGRSRTIHLNLVAYGWLSVAGFAVALWILPRMFHTPLRRPGMAMAGGAIWTLGVAAGAIAIGAGWSDGLEWLEIPWQIDIVLALGGLFLAWPALATARRREVHHIYVTGWYYLAGMAWFPILFFIAGRRRKAGWRPGPLRGAGRRADPCGRPWRCAARPAPAHRCASARPFAPDNRNRCRRHAAWGCRACARLCARALRRAIR